jgi:hypothetical protein
MKYLVIFLTSLSCMAQVIPGGGVIFGPGGGSSSGGSATNVTGGTNIVVTAVSGSNVVNLLNPITGITLNNGSDSGAWSNAPGWSLAATNSAYIAESNILDFGYLTVNGFQQSLGGESNSGGMIVSGTLTNIGTLTNTGFVNVASNMTCGLFQGTVSTFISDASKSNITLDFSYRMLIVTNIYTNLCFSNTISAQSNQDNEMQIWIYQTNSGVYSWQFSGGTGTLITNSTGPLNTTNANKPYIMAVAQPGTNFKQAAYAIVAPNN